MRGFQKEISADLAGNELNDHYGLMFEDILKLTRKVSTPLVYLQTMAANLLLGMKC